MSKQVSILADSCRFEQVAHLLEEAPYFELYRRFNGHYPDSDEECWNWYEMTELNLSDYFLADGRINAEEVYLSEK